MDQQQWITLRAVLGSVARSIKALPRCRYSDFLILQLYFWATHHDRPMTWAIQREHYNKMFRPRQCPSISQLNRRIATDRFQLLLQRVHEKLSERPDHTPITTAFIDGKALCLPPVSADRQARRGKVPGGWAKGYKLHAIVTDRRQIPVFCVMPLSRHEAPVAHRMLEHLPSLAGSLIMADGNYDDRKLHTKIASGGGCLLSKPRGRGKHPVSRRRMGAARRAMVDLWDRHPAMMRQLYRQRDTIERVFGHLSCTPGLLGPLPSFIRGLARVRRWVGAKICLYHARLIAKMTPAKTI